MWQTISEVVFFDNTEKEAMTAYFKSHRDWHVEANGTGVIFSRQRTIYTVLEKKGSADNEGTIAKRID